MAIFELGELFCGPGGLAWGATNADIGLNDYRIVHAWANDYDSDTCNTYRRNICPQDPDSVIWGDVRKLDLDKSIYFLSLAGENLFNMARSYKKVCHDKVEQIEQSAIVTDTEIFKGVAESGHNPRKFVAFNEKRLTALKNKNTRNSIAKKFSIPLDAETGKFDTSVDGASEKIVKLLCNKGMLDPFDKDAVEVDGARQWK